MHDFNIQYFDTKNTCIDARLTAKNWQSAKNKAKKLSMKFYKIVIYERSFFVEYTKGQATSASLLADFK